METNSDNSNFNIFISTPAGIDIDVLNNEIVRTKSINNQEINIYYEFPTIDEHGHSNDGEIVITIPEKMIGEAKSVIDAVLDYHGISASFDGKSVVIKDIDYLANDSLEAIETSVKGLNHHLKAARP